MADKLNQDATLKDRPLTQGVIKLMGKHLIPETSPAGKNPSGPMPSQEAGKSVPFTGASPSPNKVPGPGAGRTTSDPIKSGGLPTLAKIASRPNKPPHFSAHRRK